MKKLILLFAVVCLSTVSFATVAVTVSVKSIATTNPTASITVKFSLQNCSTGTPRIISSHIIAQTSYSFKPVSGTVTAAIYGNDEIDCGGVRNSVYTLTYMANGVPVGKQFQYVICAGAGGNCSSTGGVFNPSTATPTTSNPAIFPPTGDNTYLRLDCGNGAGFVGGSCPTGGAALSGTGFVSATSYGLSPSASATANTTALQACITASQSGAIPLTCYIPNGSYSINWVQISSSAHITCQSSNALFRVNEVSPGFPGVGGGAAFVIASNFASSYTLTTGAVAAGTTQFTLSSVTGLSVGQDVFISLGQAIYDHTGPFVTMFNRIQNITGNVVTLMSPIPDAVAAQTSPFETTPSLQTFAANGEANGVEIEGCGFTNATSSEIVAPIATVGAANVNIHDITVQKITAAAAILATDVENLKVSDVYIYESDQVGAGTGGAFRGWGIKNVTVDNLFCMDCQGPIIYLEAENRDITFNNVYYASDSAAYPNASVVISSGDTQRMRVNNYTFNPTITSLAAYTADDISTIAVNNLTVNNDTSNAMLSNLSGYLSYKGTLFPRQRTVTFTVPILASQAFTSFPLPAGYYTDLQIYSSSLTGLTALDMLSSSGGPTGVQALLTAGATVDMGSTADAFTFFALGNTNPFNYPTPVKTGYYTSDATVPAGSYLTFTLTYYPDESNVFVYNGSAAAVGLLGAPIPGAGAALMTGPATSTLGDCVKFGDTVGTLVDAGTACSRVASGTVTSASGTVTTAHTFGTAFSTTPVCTASPYSNAGAWYFSTLPSSTSTGVITYASSGAQTFSVQCTGTGGAW